MMYVYSECMWQQYANLVHIFELYCMSTDRIVV